MIHLHLKVTNPLFKFDIYLVETNNYKILTNLKESKQSFLLGIKV
jgi:hypothetical protein